MGGLIGFGQIVSGKVPMFQLQKTDIFPTPKTRTNFLHEISMIRLKLGFVHQEIVDELRALDEIVGQILDEGFDDPVHHASVEAINLLRAQ